MLYLLQMLVSGTSPLEALVTLRQDRRSFGTWTEFKGEGEYYLGRINAKVFELLDDIRKNYYKIYFCTVVFCHGLYLISSVSMATKTLTGPLTLIRVRNTDGGRKV